MVKEHSWNSGINLTCVGSRFRACCGSAAVFLCCNYKPCKHGYDNGTAGRPHPVSVGVSLQMLLQETEERSEIVMALAI